MTFFKKYQKCILFVILLISYQKIFGIEPLKIVTGNDFLPYTDEKLKNGGLFTSIYTTILKKIKIPYTIEFLPWARGYEMLKHEKFDVSFPYAPTKERASEVKYSKISLTSSDIYIYSNSNYRNTKNAYDFRNGTYCGAVGYYIEDVFLNMINKNELKKMSQFDEKSCLLAVINNDASLFVTNENQMKEYKKQKISNFDRIIRIGKPLKKMELYAIYNKKIDDKIIKMIDNEAARFLNTNEYRKLINSY
ncbi:substrate-binding periplasmic protein [Silvanigrella aquatica]|uniref:Solute-binding protein family 3/N-terminal domain-containing protein n=1 Tax=Silvanigrella aquatica TaxID=1915309 RepID=A0A1L4CX03_9BACT|nr:transporter substrate-binding domain-containing protein [Silvanigrella aquatica]APJ02474.1 hypothetical protein AXG55_00405 [Silvanigrella aquatica]